MAISPGIALLHVQLTTAIQKKDISKEDAEYLMYSITSALLMMPMNDVFDSIPDEVTQWCLEVSDQMEKGDRDDG